MADFITINNQLNYLPLTILDTLVATEDLLVYTKGNQNQLSNPTRPDLITPQANYHGGHKPFEVVTTYEDCNKLNYELVKQEIISNELRKGILVNDSSTPMTGSDWLWKEDTTTPIGLYQETTGTLANYNFKKLSSNQIQIRILDANIIPTVNDFLFIQRFFSTEFSLENPQSATIGSGDYTDDINNLPIYQSEYWTFQITDRFQEPSDSQLWTFTFDKDVNFISSEFYIFVLLNRTTSSGNLQEIFLDTWQKIEVKSKQLLGDQYNYTGALQPKGKTNHLNYDNAGYLGLKNFLSSLNNDEGIKDDFIVLDFEDNIQDHLYYPDNAIKINLPGVLINDLRGNVLTIKNKNYLLNSNVGYYGNLYYTSQITSLDKNIGYVFYDLRIMVITDLELIASMSYNSNRNFTLPEPITKDVNEVKDIFIDNFQTYLNPYTHFYTYRLKGKHYTTLPYNELKSFNWVNTQLGNLLTDNYTLELDIAEMFCLKDAINLTGFEKDQLEIIIGEWDIDYSIVTSPKVLGYKNVVVMPLVDWQLQSNTFNLLEGTNNDIVDLRKTNYNLKFFKKQYDNIVVAGTNVYDLTTFWGSNTPSTLYVSKCNWLIGEVRYKNFINQYKMKVEYRLDADRWNGTTNGTFTCDNNFQGGKLITEMGLKFGSVDAPMIYAKISPPILKNNRNDLIVRFNLDF